MRRATRDPIRQGSSEAPAAVRTRAQEGALGCPAHLALPMLALALFAGGCLGTDFDSPGLVRDTRILAVRLDPPEVELPTSPEEASLPLTATVLVADPARGAVYLETRACRHATARACGDGDTEEELAELAAIHTATLEVPAAPAAPAAIFTDDRTLAQETLRALLFPPQGGVSLAGARPAYEVAAVGESGSEVAFKRLQIGLPDLLYRTLLAEAGLSICDERGEPEGCVAYRTKVANRNPDLLGLEYRLETSAGEDFDPVPEDAPLVVPSGAPVRLRPRVSEESYEAYQTITIDFDSRTLHIEDRSEYLVFSWYATTGRLDFLQTEEERTLGIDNRWVAPTVDEEASAAVFVVVRDPRGGVDFRAVPILVRP